MSWKIRAMVLMVGLVVTVLLFQAYNLSDNVNRVMDTYLGFQLTDLWRGTADDHAHKKWLEAYLEKRAVKVREVDCRKVLDGDKREVERANATERVPVTLPSDDHVLSMASHCPRFLDHYRFLLNPLTRLEEHFPIAYSLLVFKQASQVVDLLRAVYRPQNWYCVHVDRKSPDSFRQAMEAVSRCLPNVFLASRAVNVRWGFYSVLEPELVCMKDLWRRNSTWKYFINLTGQEFPLRTNYELVRILSAYKGANDIGGHVPNDYTKSRWQKFLPAPHNISLYKGAVHIVASRGFVDYVLHDPRAQDFRHWCERTLHPDEHFFNSLNHNPQLSVPGGGSGKVLSLGGRKVFNPSVARFKNWFPTFPCPGHKIVRAICILNVLDLPLLHTRKELFANKFYADYSRLALQCLAEELYNRTREQTLGRPDFNVTFYEQQPFVKNRLW